MANVVLPTFPALASGALFIKGFAYTASAPAAYVSFGHSFQIGQLPAGSGLQVSFGTGVVPVQIDIKTKYADGSAAWAVLTVQAPGAGAAGIVWGQFSRAAGGGMALGLATVLGSTALVLTIAATTPAQTFTTDLVALVKAAAFDPWLSGSLAVQGRASVTLYQGLRALVDLTAYADGTMAADVMVANDIAMLPTAGTVDYTATLTLNGAAAYTSPALTHYQYQNWTAQVGTRGTLPQVIHNPADFIAAQAVQPWDLTLGVDPSIISGAQSIIGATGFGQPFTNPGGLMDQSMGDTGGRTDIGPNDAWSVWWLTTQDPNLLAVAMEAAKASGGIPWHYWNANSGDNYKITDLVGPNSTVGLWTGAQTDSWTVPLTQAVPSGPGWTLDDSHFPEVAYLPAILTGRRYYVDELNAATYWMLSCKWPFYRSNRLASSEWNEFCGTEGYVFPGEQIRGGAWGLRNLFWSYYATPDGDPRKTYVKQILDNNFTWLNGQTAAWSTLEGEPAGYVPVGPCCTYGSNSSAMPPWQQDYTFSSVSMGAMMGYQPAQQFAEWMANFIVGRVASNVSGWYPQDGICYNMQLFPNGYNTGDTPPQTWAAMEAALQADDASQVSSTGTPTWTHQAMGDYAALAWNSLYEAQTLGFAGAEAAINEMIAWSIPQANTEAYWTTGSGPAKMAARTLNASQVLSTSVPDPTISSIALSTDSIAYGAPSGTTVGAISVAMSDGSTFAGTLTLGGANAGDFNLNESNLITAEVLTPGAYAISVTATPINSAIAPATQSFTITADPNLLSISGVTLSADSFTYGAAAGTVVGAISVAMSSGSFSGTLTLTGTNAADFAVSGSNLVTVGALAAGSYSISIVATQSGASNSPFTQAFIITGEAQTVAQLVAKTQAALAATVSAASSSLTALTKALVALEIMEEKKLNAAIAALVTQANNLNTQSAAMLATVTADLDAVAAAIPTA